MSIYRNRYRNRYRYQHESFKIIYARRAPMPNKGKVENE